MPQNHANQEAEILVFTLRTPLKLPGPPRVCVSSRQVSESCHFAEAMCATVSLQWFPFQQGAGAHPTGAESSPAEWEQRVAGHGLR